MATTCASNAFSSAVSEISGDRAGELISASTFWHCTDASAAESVHLSFWPKARRELIDESLSRDVRLVMRVASLGRAARELVLRRHTWAAVARRILRFAERAAAPSFAGNPVTRS